MLRRSWLVVFLLVAMSGVVRGQGAVEPLLRQRGEAFAAAMTAPGDALAAFARDHLESRVAAEGRADAFAAHMRDTIADLGPVVGRSVQVPRDTLVFVYLKHARSGAWQNYQFRVNASDGHRLQLVFRAVAIEPLEPSTAPIGTPDASGWLDRLFARLSEQQPFSGVAVVRRGGRDVFTRVQGVADVADGTPVTRTSRFGMASGSKLFTAVAILQLAQAGKLTLGDPLARHLPDFPDQAFARRATIEALLTHTAGAGDYWDDDYDRAMASITEPREMLPFVLKHLGAAPPGEFSYSNSGYFLLGLVIEAVSGRSYYDYVREHVLEPAGMAATGFPLRGEEGAGAAHPYAPEMDAGAVKPGVYTPVVLGGRGTAAGGATTTADDMLRFADALTSGRLLDHDHLALLTTGRVPYGVPGSAHGCGALVETSNGVRSFGHGGRAPGTHFDFRVYPDLETVLVVLSNYDTIGGPEVSMALDRLVRNAGDPAPDAR